MLSRRYRLVAVTVLLTIAVLLGNYALTLVQNNNIETDIQETTPANNTISPSPYDWTIDNNDAVRLRILLGRESNEPGVASLKITASYHIVVERDGRVIAERYKENDPISIQWYRMVADMMFGFIRSGALTWYDTGYNSRTWVDTGYGGISPKAYIALGNGSGTPSLYDYKLFSEVTKAVSSMSVQDDATNQQYIVTYTKTFTIQQDFTLTEVGLLLYLDVYEYYDKTYAYLLVAHDSVSPSIDLVDGDSVSITYQLTIPYNTNGPFTRWFYNALINYWLGYKGTTGSSLTLKAEGGNTGAIDTAVDDRYASEANGVNGEYLYIEIGSGSSTASPLFETYTLANMLQRLPTTDEQCIAEVNETSSFQIHYILSFSFTSSASISEIGVSYYTDCNEGESHTADYYLWLYWSLPSPVNVDAGNGLRVEVTIEIPYV